MFDRTKRRIVFAIVLSLLALMAVTLATIFISNIIDMRRQNDEMLKTYVERYDPNGQPTEQGGGRHDIKPWGDLPDISDGREPMRNEPQFRLSTFYSVAFSKDGEVIAVNNGNSALQSEETLIEIAVAAVKSGKESGSSGNIHYLVSDRDDYTLVAMIDGTIGNRNQQTLIKEMLIIGGAAMAILFVISIFIAKSIVRPLEENDRRQKRFVSDAGHELKTPIAVISANSELLRRQIGECEWLSNIDYENEKMSDLVKQLLALSKAENGDIPTETVDFSKLVDGEALVFESLAYERGVAIVSETESGAIVQGNSSQLRQLVSILLDNALSHGTGDKIALTLRKEKHGAVLTVSNEAKEMDTEKLSHLFDRFYRADEARNDDGAHYGLGLSIAKAVSDAHGGQIRAEYRNGRAMFVFSLPIKKSEKN